MLKAKLENGTVKVTNYDDGMAEGIRLVLTDKDGNESEIALDILKDTGEARAVIYKVDSDEPDEIITLNNESELEFVENIESTQISEYSYIVVQEYADENDKSIYNVSIEESEDGFISETTDLFETEDEAQALSFYETLVKIYNYGKEVK